MSSVRLNDLNSSGSDLHVVVEDDDDNSGGESQQQQSKKKKEEEDVEQDEDEKQVRVREPPQSARGARRSHRRVASSDVPVLDLSAAKNPGGKKAMLQDAGKAMSARGRRNKRGRKEFRTLQVDSNNPLSVRRGVEKEFSRTELRRLHLAFDTVDSNHDRRIDEGELSAVLRRLGLDQYASSSRLNLLAPVDKDEDQQVSWEEFLDLVLILRDNEFEHEIEQRHKNKSSRKKSKRNKKKRSKRHADSDSESSSESSSSGSESSDSSDSSSGDNVTNDASSSEMDSEDEQKRPHRSPNKRSPSKNGMRRKQRREVGESPALSAASGSGMGKSPSRVPLRANGGSGASGSGSSSSSSNDSDTSGSSGSSDSEFSDDTSASDAGDVNGNGVNGHRRARRKKGKKNRKKHASSSSDDGPGAPGFNEPGERAPPGKCGRFATIALSALFFTAYVDVGVIPVVALTWRDEYDISTAEMGMLPLVFLAGYALATYVVSMATRGTKRPCAWIYSLLVLYVLAIGYTSQIDDFRMILYLRTAAGAFKCIFAVFMFPALFSLEPQAPLLWSGIASVMIPLGMGAGYAGAGYALDNGYEWQDLFQGCGALVAVNFVVLLLAYPGLRRMDVTRRMAIPVHSASYKRDLRALYGRTFNIVCGVIAGMFYFVIHAVQFWIVVFFVDFGQKSRTEAALVGGGLLVVCSFAGSVLGAYAVHKVKAGVHSILMLFVVSSLCTTVGLLGMFIVEEGHSVLLYPGSAAVLTFLAMHLPMIHEIPMRMLEPRFHDFAMSRLTMIQSLCGTSGALVVGIFLGITEIQTAFLLLSWVCFIIILLSIYALVIYDPGMEMRLERLKRQASAMLDERKRRQALNVWRQILARLAESNFAADLQLRAPEEDANGINLQFI